MFSRRWLLLAVFLCQFLLSVTETEDNCTTYLNRFQGAASLTLPVSTLLTVATGESIIAQCQTNCGIIEWMINGVKRHDINRNIYLANCNECTSTFFFCDAEQSDINTGPLVSNATLSFDTPGQYLVQCRVQQSFKKYPSSELYSQAILINVQTTTTATESQVLFSSSISPSPTSSLAVTSTVSLSSLIDRSVDGAIPNSCTNEIVTVTESAPSFTPAAASAVSTSAVITTGSPASTALLMSGINISEDPISIALIAGLAITTLLAVIGWLAFFAQCYVNIKRSSTKDDTELQAIKTTAAKAKPNSYVTVSTVTNDGSIKSMESSPVLLVPPSTQPTRQSSTSVETYVIDTAGKLRTESLL